MLLRENASDKYWKHYQSWKKVIGSNKSRCLKISFGIGYQIWNYSDGFIPKPKGLGNLWNITFRTSERWSSIWNTFIEIDITGYHQEMVKSELEALFQIHTPVRDLYSWTQKTTMTSWSRSDFWPLTLHDVSCSNLGWSQLLVWRPNRPFGKLEVLLWMRYV